MNIKIVYLQAALYTIIGALTPLLTVLTGDMSLTKRVVAGAIIGGIIGAATSLKAFLSTTFAATQTKA